MHGTSDNASRPFDLVLWGATGFTGRLVAEYLIQRYGDAGLRWAMAGRNIEKLEQVRTGLGAGASTLPLITADSHDRDSLDELAAQARVVCTTVGPYALYGSELVAACAAAGTHYCDLSGEVPWMQEMIDAHEGAARESGSRIVHCCGFDSIPSDLGVHFLQREAVARLGEPCTRVALRVKAMRGGASGGTVASMLNLLERAREDRALARVLRNPYALCPPGQREGPRQATHGGASFDADVDSWIGPFVMAVVNTRVVHRSHALRGRPWGADFRYDEASMTGAGMSGRLKALTLAGGLGAFTVAAALGPTRALMKRTFLPEPGEGPTREQRERGFYKLLLTGHTDAGAAIRVAVTGDRDPGYGSTSKMLAESAVCLARDPLDVGGGCWTPATSMGDRLVDRLQANAGLAFRVEATQPAGAGG